MILFLPWPRRPRRICTAPPIEGIKGQQQGPGRPRTPGEVEALVCRLARENTWGNKRLSGELKKLGIQLSKSCIADILRRNDLPPSPERKGLTWREFLARLADVLLCADLFTKEIWTFCGLRRAFVLAVMHLRSRTIRSQKRRSRRTAAGWPSRCETFSGSAKRWASAPGFSCMTGTSASPGTLPLY